MAGRLESGAIKLEAAPMDLIPVLRESVQAIMPIAYKKTVSAHLDVAEESLTVMGEKSGLQQVFINLINNAVKFSPEGSAVEVITRRSFPWRRATAAISRMNRETPLTSASVSVN